MATRKTIAASEPIVPRQLWLAGLGLATVARREAGNAACAALASANAWRDRASAFAGDARDVVRGSALALREKIEPALDGLAASVEARVAPLLERAGIARPVSARAVRKPRRPSAKKPATRRQPRRAPVRKARAVR